MPGTANANDPIVRTDKINLIFTISSFAFLYTNVINGDLRTLLV